MGTKRRRLGLSVLVGCAGLTLAGLSAAVAQSAPPADITADSMTYNWDTNVFVFSGNAKVVITEPYQATLTGPRMTVQMSNQMQGVTSVVADGPVRMVLLTQADAQGVRYQITATAQDRAEYSDADRKILLRGGAEADLVSLPEGPDSRRAHFTGDVIAADLKTSQLTVTQARVRVTAPVPPASAPAAQ